MPDPTRLHQARIDAAKKLQHLCWDAAHQEDSAFMNRDRALEVVDSLVVAILETFDEFVKEEKKDAASNN
jgi:hypothetical protein